MAGKLQYENVLTEDFFVKYYISGKMSYPKISAMMKDRGVNISVGTLHKYAKRLGIGRSISEAKRTLNYSISFMTESTMGAIDGFLLGDGGIESFSMGKMVTRLKCGLEYKEFCEYLMKSFNLYAPTVIKVNSFNMKQGFVWMGQTKFHPDLYKQRLRWYPKDGTKQVPNDVRITPKSVMMWYLGDGSVVQHGNNSISLRLSTDGFKPSGVHHLVRKLRKVGIESHRNGDNRVYVEAKGIPAFFDFIGRKSPVACYDYKFDLPEWRFEAKRMKQVSEELGVEYQRMAHLVKVGKLECYRASEKGRPRFLPEHIKQAKELITIGELY